jgi:hypothetical protein
MAAIPPTALMPDQQNPAETGTRGRPAPPESLQEIDPAQHDPLDQRFYLWRLSGAFAQTHNRNNNQDGFSAKRSLAGWWRV